MRGMAKGLVQRALLYPAERLASRVLASERPFASRHYTRFVIIAAGRSGTSLLRERLDSHPQIACHPELFNQDRTRMQRWHGEAQMQAIAARRDADSAGFVRRAIWRPYSGGTQAVGFKILYHHWQVNRDALEGAGLLEDVRFIHLQRRDAFARYRSELRAWRSGRYHRRGAARGHAPDTPVEIDCEAMLRRMAEIEAQAEDLSHWLGGRSSLSLQYEDMVADPAGTDRKLCEFLGVERRSLASSLAPTGGAPLERQVANLGEVRAALAGTNWETPPRDAH